MKRYATDVFGSVIGLSSTIRPLAVMAEPCPWVMLSRSIWTCFPCSTATVCHAAETAAGMAAARRAERIFTDTTALPLLVFMLIFHFTENLENTLVEIVETSPVNRQSYRPSLAWSLYFQ